MDWLGFLGSVIGGAVGGLFTLIGVKETIKHNEKTKEKERLQKEFENRPNLVLKDCKMHNKLESNGANMQAVHAPIRCQLNNKNFDIIYSKDILDDKKLCQLTFEFVNEGRTTINSISLANNLLKDTSLLPLSNRKMFYDARYYNVVVEKDYINVKPGDKFVINICYLKTAIISGMISAPVSLYITDINNNMWEQPLFISSGEVGSSSRTIFEKFKAYTDQKKIDECFINPMLW